MAKRGKRKKIGNETSEPKANKEVNIGKKRHSEDSGEENKEFFEQKIKFPIFNKAKRHFENKAFKFVFLFAVFITFFYILFLLFIEKLSFVMEFVAGNVGFLLNLFGIKALVNGTQILMENFSMEVIFECTPLFTILIYFACVLAYPAKPGAKIKGMLFGGTAIYFIDITRLFSLAIIGKTSPEMFNYIHTYLWQITLVIVILAIWLFWIDKFTKTTTKATAN